MGLRLDEEAVSRLEAFEALLRNRAVPLGLIAPSDASRIHDRHIIDCLRAAAAVRPTDRLAFDIGSGAGLPGLVVAAACPRLQVRTVEPRRARVAFLELAIERLALANAAVVPTRIEDVEQKADLCFARAFAPLGDAWRGALPHLRPGGRLVYFMGAGGSDAPEGGSEGGARAKSIATSARERTGAGTVQVLIGPVLESGGPLIIMAQ